MEQDLSESMAVTNTALDQRLKREGWSLHDRLALAAAQGAEPLHGSGLDHWRQVVAPDNRWNFEKRLHWEGLTTASAAWALDPPDEATPDHPPGGPCWKHCGRRVGTQRLGRSTQSLSNAASTNLLCICGDPLPHGLLQRCGIVVQICSRGWRSWSRPGLILGKPC